MTIRGGVLGGLLGPVFLLAPIGLLALRWRLGRRALMAALVFAIDISDECRYSFSDGGRAVHRIRLGDDACALASDGAS